MIEEDIKRHRMLEKLKEDMENYCSRFENKLDGWRSLDRVVSNIHHKIYFKNNTDVVTEYPYNIVELCNDKTRPEQILPVEEL